MARRLGECRYAIHPTFGVLAPLRAAGSISTADGSALVRMGGTTIICGVKAEIAEPDLDLPEQGFLGHSPTRSFHWSSSKLHTVPNLDLPAICSPKFKPGPPTEEAQVLSDRLNEALVTFVAFVAISSILDWSHASPTAPASFHYLHCVFILAKLFGRFTLTPRA